MRLGEMEVSYPCALRDGVSRTNALHTFLCQPLALKHSLLQMPWKM